MTGFKKSTNLESLTKVVRRKRKKKRRRSKTHMIKPIKLTNSEMTFMRSHSLDISI
jgi:hypothetical protein